MLFSLRPVVSAPVVENHPAAVRFESEWQLPPPTKRASNLILGLDRAVEQHEPTPARATDLPDAEYPNYFLTTFAKPKRASVWRQVRRWRKPTPMADTT